MSGVKEPRWLRVVALLPALAVASFGFVGLFFADIGFYRPPLVLPIGAALFAALCVCALPVLRRSDGEAPIGSTLCSVTAVAFSVAYAIWNGYHASQHVQINRDGGLYLNAGKWIAAHGTLRVHPIAGAFSTSSGLTYTSNGMALVGRRLEFSVSHMLPALLAEAQGLGGDHLMFLAAPILSGLALIGFYTLAFRLLRSPLGALGATACTAFVMPQVSFSRDTTSEVPTQILLFAAVWLLCNRETWRARRTALCAGLVLGVVQAMHIDGLACMLGLPFVIAAVAVRQRGREERHARAVVVWLVVGLFAGLALGAFDLAVQDRAYASSVRGQLLALTAALAVTTVIATAVAVRSRRVDHGSTAASSQRPLSIFTTAATLVVGLGAWFLRPLLQETHGAGNGTVAFVQTLEHVQIDSTRAYGELSVRWLSWYLGPVTLLLGIVAAAVLAGALVEGRVRWPARVCVLMLAPPALIYLWKPSITPDHVWAMRRFLPAVIPGVILLAFGALCAVVRATRPGPAFARKLLAVVVGLCAIGFPIGTIAGVASMTEQRGEYAAVRATCGLLGRRSAAIVLQDADAFLYRNDPQTLRSFCDIPVAVALGTPKEATLREMAKSWKNDGRELFVVAESPDTIRHALPGLAFSTSVDAVNHHLLNPSLLERPGHYTSESLRFVVARVPSQ